jgi:outer membrane protein assembly factor BamA
VGWQGRHTSAAVSYLYTISDGGGLVGAVHSNAGAITLRQQLTRAWSLGASGTYADNTLVESAAATDLDDNGHTLGGSVSVQRTIGEHFSAQVGYSHLHQDYDNVAALATVTGRNREWMAVTYNFTRPLGR